MKRQLSEKGTAPAVQLKRSANSREDADRPNLLTNSARKIGSVLGNTVAKTERSLSVRKPKIELAPQTKGSGGGSRKTSLGRETATNIRSENSLLMPSLRRHFKTPTDSVRRPPSKDAKRKSRIATIRLGPIERRKSSSVRALRMSLPLEKRALTLTRATSHEDKSLGQLLTVPADTYITFRLLKDAGILAECAAVETLAGEMMELVDLHKPDVVCISALPPAAVRQASYLCKRLRARFPELQIMVGLWDALGEPQKARDRIASAGANHTVITFAQGLEHLGQLEKAC